MCERPGKKVVLRTVDRAATHRRWMKIQRRALKFSSDVRVMDRDARMNEPVVRPPDITNARASSPAEGGGRGGERNPTRHCCDSRISDVKARLVENRLSEKPGRKLPSRFNGEIPSARARTAEKKGTNRRAGV